MNREIDFLIAIINPILNNRGALKVEKTIDEKGVLLTLTIAQEDMGRIIGREGQTAGAIRVLLRQFGGTQKQNISLKINEPYVAHHPNQEEAIGLAAGYRTIQ